MTLFEMIREIGRTSPTSYCKSRCISLSALKRGYVSRATAKILKKDNIPWKYADNIYERGGKRGTMVRVKYDECGERESMSSKSKQSESSSTERAIGEHEVRFLIPTNKLSTFLDEKNIELEAISEFVTLIKDGEELDALCWKFKEQCGYYTMVVFAGCRGLSPEAYEQTYIVLLQFLRRFGGIYKRSLAYIFMDCDD